MIGGDRIFMDLEDIVPGQNFADTIDRSITASRIALIVIGPRWLQSLRDRAESSRPDYVRHEIASALAHKLNIVPVLVGGASMPSAADLPADLSGLAFYQAMELRDASFKDDCERLAKVLELERQAPPRRKWIWAAFAGAAVLAIIGLWLWRSSTPPDPRLATAKTQTELGEHRSAFYTYQEIIAGGNAKPEILELQTDAAMQWVRDFRITVAEGQNPGDLAGPSLDDIMKVLEAALARSGGRGPRAGDILAHLGWAHWLNRHIAQREFGPAAERLLRQSLEVDPKNVFGHMMLGNWLVQARRPLTEALQHFDAAEATGQQRPLLRRMQLGALIQHPVPGVPVALMPVVNRMRANGESISDRDRSRMMYYFRPGNNEDMRQMLSAVPPAEAWATFVWLDNASPRDDHEGLRRKFVRAHVLELEGKTAEAITILEGVDKKLRSEQSFGRFLDDVSEAAARIRSASRK